MAATLTNPNTGLQTVRLHALTPQAAKQIEQLTKTDRQRVVATVSKPVCANRCRQLHGNLAKYRVYHFDVTDSLRVSYRRIDSKACILHVGTHPEFDEFAAHYTGSLPNQLIPIEESTMMTQHLKQNGKTTPNGRPDTQPQALLVAPPAVAAEGAELLSQAVLAIFARAF